MLIIARAMKERQEERFCDAQEMLRALQDIHAIDGRYKKVVHSQRVVAAVSLVLAVSGTLAILFGVQRIGVERYAAYDASCGKAGRPPMKCALMRRSRTCSRLSRFTMTSWKHMWNRQSFSIGRESIRSASMQWKRRSRVS